MENDEILLKKDYFETSFKKQDVTSLPDYKKWYSYKKKEKKEIVRCPICWSYETFIEPTNHICQCCSKEYCQKCLKIIVEGEVKHDHERGCCSKFKGLIDDIIEFGGEEDWKEPQFYILTAIIFLFGTPTLFSYKYFKFFQKNNIIENDCVHNFFRISNLFANIIYIILFNFTYLSIFLIVFLPSIFWFKYFKIIMNNWMEVIYELEVDEIPITELTVCGKGFRFY